MKPLLLISLLTLVNSLTFTHASLLTSELEGICDEPNTAASCTVINQTGHLIRKVEWTIEGNWFDFGGEAIVNLKNGESAMVSNREGRNNCLFTEYTWITATAEDDHLDFFESEDIKFDRKGNCTIVL